MSDFLNLAEFDMKENQKEKKDQNNPLEINKNKSIEKYIEQQPIKNTFNEKIDSLTKKKKKLTNFSDPSLLEADILNESYSEISNNQIIRETIENLNHLFIEEDNIISKIIDFSYDADNLYRTRDLFDALFYEFKIRFQNKKLALNQLKDKEEQNFEYIKNLENNLKKSQNELTGLKKFQETKQFRHGGKIKIKSDQEMKDLDIYDWIIDIDLISSILTNGWKIYFNSLYYQSLQFDEENNFFSSNQENFLKDSQQSLPTIIKPIERVVSFLGLYDKGKSFVLNNLTNTSLPSEKKVQTRGISFKEFQLEDETKLILLDTIGSYSPVNVINENSVNEKESTEQFLLEFVFEISDYFICLMNDFTAVDQRYLDKLSKILKKYRNKSINEIIVVHNFKEVESQEILDHLWETQAPKIYGEGIFQRTKVSAINPINGKFQEKHVHWFQTNYSRHVRLANDDSMLGNSLNPWTFSLLKHWLTTDVSPEAYKPVFTIKRIMEIFSHYLSLYFKEEVQVKIENSNEKLVKNIKINNKLTKSLEKSNVLANCNLNNDLVNTTHLSKMKVYNKNDEYIVCFNVPGYCFEDFLISELESKITINKKQKLPEIDSIMDETDERKEENEPILVIDAPKNYDKKWSDFSVEKGVLTLKFKKILKDNEESHN